MESLRGVSHLVFKDLKSGTNRLTFLDLLRILLVTSNPDDLKVCESWVKEQEQISKITREIIHHKCKQAASQIDESAIKVYEKVYDCYNISKTGIVTR